jgi:hypothetical protein
MVNTNLFLRGLDEIKEKTKRNLPKFKDIETSSKHKIILKLTNGVGGFQVFTFESHSSLRIFIWYFSHVSRLIFMDFKILIFTGFQVPLANECTFLV